MESFCWCAPDRHVSLAEQDYIIILYIIYANFTGLGCFKTCFFSRSSPYCRTLDVLRVANIPSMPHVSMCSCGAMPAMPFQRSELDLRTSELKTAGHQETGQRSRQIGHAVMLMRSHEVNQIGADLGKFF